MQRLEYQSILSIAIEHAYYADGRVPGFDWEPTAETQAWLSARRILMRNTTAGFQLLSEGSALPASTDSDTQTLVWRFYSHDVHFEPVTDQAPLDRQSLYRFVLPADAQPEDRPMRLHVAATASSQDWVGIGFGAVSQWIEPAANAKIPIGVVSVPVPDARSPILEHRYRIAFGARATFWRYNLVGAWPTEGLRIADSAGKVQFDAFKERMLEGGQRVLSSRSMSTITLQERPQIRLQLRDGPGDDAPILIRRLPVADVQLFVRETFDQHPALVSEVHLYR